jgi:hypothetical protein
MVRDILVSRILRLRDLITHSTSTPSSDILEIPKTPYLIDVLLLGSLSFGQKPGTVRLLTPLSVAPPE